MGEWCRCLLLTGGIFNKSWQEWLWPSAVVMDVGEARPGAGLGGFALQLGGGLAEVPAGLIGLVEVLGDGRRYAGLAGDGGAVGGGGHQTRLGRACS